MHIISAASRLCKIGTYTIWSSIITCWIMIYTGLPNGIKFDEGCNFEDPLYIWLPSMISNSKWQQKKLEIACPFLIDTKNKSVPLCASQCNNNQNHIQTCSWCSFNAANDTAGPDDWKPSAILFVTYKRIEMPREFGWHPQQRMGVNCSHNLERDETTLENMRLKWELNRNVPK